MKTDRRSFLKGLAALSVAPILSTYGADALATTEPLTETYLLLQGLFFLEFNDSTLTVATAHHKPAHHPHVFYTRDHGKNDLVDLLENPQYALAPGTFCCLPPEIPQFSNKVINQAPGFLKNCKQYRCKMVLPCPKTIFALRRGNSSDFWPDTSTKVGNDLGYGAEIATVVALVYDPAPNATPFVRSFYAEHVVQPATVEVNDALKSAQEICGHDFDLQFLECMAPITSVDNDADLPPGLDHTDEYSIEEVLGLSNASMQKPRGAIQPSTCGDLRKMLKPSSRKSCKFAKLAGDVSSCPILGIHH